MQTNRWARGPYGSRSHDCASWHTRPDLAAVRNMNEPSSSDCAVTLDDLRSRLATAAHGFSCDRIAMREATEWHLREGVISHVSGGYFSVVGVDRPDTGGSPRRRGQVCRRRGGRSLFPPRVDASDRQRTRADRHPRRLRPHLGGALFEQQPLEQQPLEQQPLEQ